MIYLVNSLIQEIIVGIVLTIGSKLLLKLWVIVKENFIIYPINTNMKKNKESIRAQFYIFIVVGILCLIALPSLSGVAKFFSGLFSFTGFLGTWVAFDEAFRHWDNDVNESVDNNSDDKSD